MALRGNKGEWSEIYIFFKILTDKRIYTADANFNRLEDVFLDVLSIIREEQPNEVYNYNTGDVVVINHNGKEIGRMNNSKFVHFMNILWKLMCENNKTTFPSKEIEDFLNSIFIYKLKSPSKRISNYFGGTVDIMLDARDKDAYVRRMGFSCKSDLTASSTLFNASTDNTNFVYKLTGLVNDEVMEHFNNLFKWRESKDELVGDIATGDRMDYLKEVGVDLDFVGPAKELAYSNLVICGGNEMPSIVGGMLKHFYYNNSGRKTTVKDCIDNLVETNPAGYQIKQLYTAYYRKVTTLLYDCFTGMRLGSEWDGKSQCTGGYIVLKNDGDVVAYHSTIADEFKDFLVDKLRMEGPSHKRHKDMVIYKKNGEYYLKLAMQFRFQLSR